MCVCVPNDFNRIISGLTNTNKFLKESKKKLKENFRSLGGEKKNPRPIVSESREKLNSNRKDLHFFIFLFFSFADGHESER